jgi:hypothetical protein
MVDFPCFVVVVGSGESGKSTVTKQMKIIFLQGYSNEERNSYKDIIHSNVIMAMRAIVNAGERLNMNNILPENKVRAWCCLSDVDCNGLAIFLTYFFFFFFFNDLVVVSNRLRLSCSQPTRSCSSKK